MSWLEFIASVVRSLAWPACVALVVLLLRDKLRELLGPTLKRLKFGPAEAEWEQSKEKLERSLPSVSDTAVEESPTGAQPSADDPIGERLPARDELELTSESLDDLKLLADDQPELAVIMAMRSVESRLKAVLRGHVPESQLERGGIARLVRLAKQESLIEQNVADSIRQLSNMRNLVVHDGRHQASPKQALEFLVLSDVILTLLGLELGLGSS